MNSNDQTIYIVDDDATICDALRFLFECRQYCVKTYLNAKSFMEHYDNKKQGCIILDVRMPDMSGLELLEQLNFENNRLPIIMMSGYGDIPMAIRAMKLGALDFILKPFTEQNLLDSVQTHIAGCVDRHINIEIVDRIRKISNREHQVLDLICEGKLNKEIAYELSISMSTVEVHRANIMKKMKAKTSAELIKLYLQSQPHTLR